jgi:hypothetical protein|tara:strand:- start:1157 stop:1951 length:795 start_codon:yes stop_codon:yes gene_type:complete
MMREKDLRENGLADMAFKVESDHEVQMARAELYKVAKYAIKMHEMLKGVEEREGLEGWVQSKITKAADYLGSVYHHMDYEMKFEQVSESKKDDKFEPHKMYKDGKVKMAKTNADHVRLGKQGWSHDNPKTKKVEEGKKKNCGCGKDPCITYGKIKEDDSKDPDTAFVRWLKSNYNKSPRDLKGNEYVKMSKEFQASKKDESYVDYLQSKLDEAKGLCSDCGNPSYTTLPEEKQKGVDGKVCWKGYKRMGTKKKGGKTVDNCVKM